jgi:hypothetical protein
MDYYCNTTQQCMDDFNAIQTDKKKVLLINSCGWVEGLGKDIQLKVVDIIKPQILVTMIKYGQGLKGNEFSEQVRPLHPEIQYVDVENDLVEGLANVKGPVQRNKKILQALSSE